MENAPDPKESVARLMRLFERLADAIDLLPSDTGKDVYDPIHALWNKMSHTLGLAEADENPSFPSEIELASIEQRIQSLEESVRFMNKKNP